MLETPCGRTLVIPMYREAGRIEAAIRELSASALAAGPMQVILVDDGSDDGTADVAEKALVDAGMDAMVLRLPGNRGKGAAVRAGVLRAIGDVVAFTDADLSASVEEIERCFSAVEKGEADVAFATRSHPDSIIADPQPALRQISGKGFNLILRTLGMTSHLDTQCGLKAFTREAAVDLFRHLHISGFAFDVEILLRAEARGLRVTEIPITWRHVEASRVSALRDGLRMTMDVLRLKRRIRDEQQLVDRPKPLEMSEATFDVMSKLEREHWWFLAKRKLVSESLDRYGSCEGVALDVGCGTGESVRSLLDFDFSSVVGTDLSPYATALAAKAAPPRSAFLVTRAEELPFASGQVGALTSLDVVEHLDDDLGAVQEYARTVRPGGVVVLAVPAYQWAWSDHDVALGHRRRYVASEMRVLAEQAGLEVVRCTYFHSWLVPLAFVLRRTPARYLVKGSSEEASFVNERVNRVLRAVTDAERLVARFIDIPFGLSILMVARVP